jgi:hypothetical protein
MTPMLVALAIVIDPGLAAKIAAVAVAVGTLGTIAQAILQKPWWPSKVKWALGWAWAILGGLSGYIVINGLPSEIGFNNLSALFAFVVGAYGAIQLAYQALKTPIVAKLERVGLGAKETPPGKPEDPEDHDGYRFRSRVPDPYGDEL